MATLTVTTSRDFRGDTLTNIDRINFEIFSATVVTFSASQFGPGKISNTVLIDGQENSPERIVNIQVILSSAGTFSAAGWTFQDWQPPPNDFDRVFIDGSNGNDIVTGTAFADTMFGSPGADQFNGGGGRDFVSYIDAPASSGSFGVTAVLLNPALNSGEAQNDGYNSIEDLAGSQFNDVLGGTNGANTIIGVGGRDTITAQGGNDTVFGGAGDDTIRGQDQNDTLNGDNENDTLFGNNDVDTLNGGAGTDTLIGGLNGDALNGGGGSDTASYQEAISVGGNGVTVFLTAPNFNSNEASGDSYNSIENLTGSDFNDFLRGDDNGNRLTGRDGIDSLFGIGGSDVLIGDDGNDSLDGGNQNDNLSGGAGDDRLFGQANNDTLNGGNQNDTLNGADGIDTLNGGNNDDSLRGGLLADTLDGSNGIDRADFTDKTGDIVLTLNGATTATATIGGAAEDTVRNIENVSGGTGNDTLTGDSLANSLSGGAAGADILTGRGGADVLAGNGGDDEFRYLAASDVVAGEVVNGGANSDTLRFSNTGVLNFQPVTPISIERLVIANASSFARIVLSSSQFGTGISNAVEITGNAQQNAIQVEMPSPGSFSAENWTFVGWGTGGDFINLIGSAGADTIVGSSRSDQITGGDGADNLSGGPGGGGAFFVDSNDVVAGEIIDGGPAGGIVNLLSSNATTDLSPAQLIDIDVITLNIRANATAILKGSQIGGPSDITLVESRDVNLVQKLVVNADPNVDLSAVQFSNWDSPNKSIFINGTSAANTLVGSDQGDTIDGKSGADTMRGALGDDTYIVDHPNDAAIEAAGQGFDTVIVRTINVLQAGSAIELLTTDTTAAIDLKGNELSQELEGNDAINTLDGGGGGDTLEGKAGDDTYVINHANDTIIEVAGGGNDKLRSGVNYVLDTGVLVETVQTLGPATTTAVNLTGNEIANTIIGNNGANVMVGGGAADTLEGRGGNDAYFVDLATDEIIEAAGQGTDNVNASASYTLDAGVSAETLRTNDATATTAINLVGNEITNVVTGNAGTNILSGGTAGEIDTLQGLGNNDSYIVDNAFDVVTEAAGFGTDNVSTSVSYVLAAGVSAETLRTTNVNGTTAINLSGNEFNNIVTGNAGTNVIAGKLGNDTLNGNGGADFFLFDTALNASTNIDTITDFDVAVDTIRLENAIFTTLTATGTLDVDAFHAGTAAADAEDRIIYNNTNGALIFDPDGTGAAGSARFATLATGLALTNADFAVV